MTVRRSARHRPAPFTPERDDPAPHTHLLEQLGVPAEVRAFNENQVPVTGLTVAAVRGRRARGASVVARGRLPGPGSRRQLRS